jgi:hypothetical protein
MKLSIQEAKDFFNEHGGELCEFRDHDGADWSKPIRLAGIGKNSYQTESGSWYLECRPYAKPEPKIWTCETAPRNLRIRGKGWSSGAYSHTNVFLDGASFHDYLGRHYVVTWKELAEDYKQFDGSPCYDEKEQD